MLSSVSIVFALDSLLYIFSESLVVEPGMVYFHTQFFQSER
jgi:hypothetical protein